MAVKWNFSAEQMIREQAHRGASLLAKALFDQIIISISEQGPPRSDPGDPPAMDSQDLISGFELDVDRNGLEYSITSDQIYSVYLELGTAFIDARPYLFPAMTFVQQNADAIVHSGAEEPRSDYNYSDVIYS